MKVRIFITILCLLVLLAPVQAYAGSISIYLPIHSARYSGLIDQLNERLTHKQLSQFQFKASDYWHPFQQGIRQGRDGVYLAPPHFAAWAIHKHRFIPVAKLEGNLTYVIVARKDDLSLFEIDDLNNRKVCSQAALNLDYLTLRQAFSNPLYSAETVIVADVFQYLQEDNAECEAFAISNHQFFELDAKSPDLYIRLQQGETWPSYAFVSHPEVETISLLKLRNFLLTKDIQAALEPILKKFSESGSLSKAYLRDYPEQLKEILQTDWGE